MYQSEIFTQLTNSLNDEFKEETEIYDILSDVIKAQYNAYDIERNNKLYFSAEKIKDRIELILNSDYIEGFPVYDAEFVLEFNRDTYELDSFVFNVVFSELLINIKRYSNIENRNIKISFIDETIIFKNDKLINPTDGNTKEGLVMCEDICRKLSLRFVKTETETEFTIEISRL